MRVAHPSADVLEQRSFRDGLLARTLWRPSIVLLLALVGVGLAVPHLFPSQVPVLVTILTVLIFAYCWNPVGGMLGEMSLGHVLFWAAGTYSAVLAINAGRPVVACVVIGIVVAMILAIITIEFAFIARLDGLFLAVFGMVLVFFAQAVARDSDFLGGDEGVIALRLPLSFTAVYYAAVALSALLIIVNMAFLSTRRGLAWLAIRDEPDRVGALGWSARKERRIAYLSTAALCAVGGALQAASLGNASPEASISFELVIVPLLAIYVGGPGTVWGPLAGVALLQTFSAIAGSQSTSVSTAETAQLLQYGIALLVITYVMHRQRRRRLEAMGKSEDAEDTADDGLRDRTWKSRATGLVDRLRTGRSRVELPPARGARTTRHAEPGPLVVERLRKSFGGLHVLEDVSFAVQPGEVLGLVGPNGAGKSTICNIIAGLIRQDDGTVMLGAHCADRLPPHRRTLMGLGRSYQSPRVFPSLTLAENVAIAGSSTGTRDAARLLAGLGVTSPSKLGETATLMERRMVEIGRLVALRPQWVLLDEPLAGLGYTEHDRILTLIRELADNGANVLVIEHLVPVIARVTDRIVVLDRGRLIAEGPPRDVLRQQEVVDAYLGVPLAVELEVVE